MCYTTTNSIGFDIFRDTHIGSPNKTECKRTDRLMANLNDFTVNKNAKFILGKECDVTVTSTFNLYDCKKRIGLLNYGKCTDENGYVHEAYIIGEDKPVSKFHGKITAIARLKNCSADEVWIVCPEGTLFYEPKITRLLSKYLPEQDYDFICLYEKSCGAVMYTYVDGERKYILITNISGHIGFPKGHIEAGENERATAMREVYEETGVHTELIDGFRESYNYLINGYIRKKAVYFLATFNADDIKMNIMEISEYRLLTFDEAMKLLNFRHDKEILEKADSFITILEGTQNR